eukprot:gene10985-biopygen6332
MWRRKLNYRLQSVVQGWLSGALSVVPCSPVTEPPGSQNSIEAEGGDPPADSTPTPPDVGTRPPLFASIARCVGMSPRRVGGFVLPQRGGGRSGCAQVLQTSHARARCIPWRGARTGATSTLPALTGPKPRARSPLSSTAPSATPRRARPRRVRRRRRTSRCRRTRSATRGPLNPIPLPSPPLNNTPLAAGSSPAGGPCAPAAEAGGRAGPPGHPSTRPSRGRSHQRCSSDETAPPTRVASAVLSPPFGRGSRPKEDGGGVQRHTPPWGNRTCPRHARATPAPPQAKNGLQPAPRPRHTRASVLFPLASPAAPRFPPPPHMTRSMYNCSRFGGNMSKISFWEFGCGNWRPGLIKHTKKVPSSLDPKPTLFAGKVTGNCENWCTQTQHSGFSPQTWKSGGGVGKTGVPKVRQIRTISPGVGHVFRCGACPFSLLVRPPVLPARAFCVHTHVIAALCTPQAAADGASRAKGAHGLAHSAAPRHSLRRVGPMTLSSGVSCGTLLKLRRGTADSQPPCQRADGHVPEWPAHAAAQVPPAAAPAEGAARHHERTHGGGLAMHRAVKPKRPVAPMTRTMRRAAMSAAPGHVPNAVWHCDNAPFQTSKNVCPEAHCT